MSMRDVRLVQGVIIGTYFNQFAIPRSIVNAVAGPSAFAMVGPAVSDAASDVAVTEVAAFDGVLGTAKDY
jgi:hypothetical protein